MRPILTTITILCWMGFSVTSGFETNLGSVQALEEKEVENIINLPDPSVGLDRAALPHGEKVHSYKLAMRQKSKVGSAKWLDGINEEGPLDREEAAFINSQAKDLVNPNTYESEYEEDLKKESKWSEYVEDESGKHKGSSNPYDAF
jgi:hypothetical protein